MVKKGEFVGTSGFYELCLFPGQFYDLKSGSSRIIRGEK
jgi:hypothetical protein